MKVVIITLFSINNYGSVFQTLATEHLLELMGCEVETIDYIRETAQTNSVADILRLKSKSGFVKFVTLSKNKIESPGRF